MKKNIQTIYCTNFPFLVAISADTRKKIPDDLDWPRGQKVQKHLFTKWRYFHF